MKIQKIIAFSILLILVATITKGCQKFETDDKIQIAPSENTICMKLYPPLDTVIASHTTFTRFNYAARIRVFMADTIDQGDIVMLGNSLTEKGGNWNTKLERINVKNRGIAGDNTDGVLARLNELICMKPSTVFIMIGTNDLFLSYNPERIKENIDSIGSLLATKLPESEIIVQTIMPLGSGHDKKSKLISINDLLKGIKNHEYKLLDTYQHMADENGDLPAAYTYDNVHLSPTGYTKWVEFIKSKIDE